MAVTVTGIDQAGRPYTARVGLDPDAFADTPGGSYGETVRCTSHVVTAGLRADHGEDVPLTPTGPSVTLHDYDTGSVLAWLRKNTNVVSEAADDGATLPRDLRVGPNDPDLIY
jgi:hypothetical protein